MIIITSQGRLTRDIETVGAGEWSIIGVAMTPKKKKDEDRVVFANCIDFLRVINKGMAKYLVKGASVVISFQLTEVRENGSLAGELLCIEFLKAKKEDKENSLPNSGEINEEPF